MIGSGQRDGSILAGTGLVVEDWILGLRGKRKKINMGEFLARDVFGFGDLCFFAAALWDFQSGDLRLAWCFKSQSLPSIETFSRQESY